MRVIKYKDILWAVAYQLGRNPDVGDFLENQARSINFYINAWVRRMWPLQDWPEWTKTGMFTPDANHLVFYDPQVFGPPDTEPAHIDRVFEVYLNDPAITDAPVATTHTLREEGVHCGFEHGTNVWIKYLEPPPQYTAEQWRAGTTYAKDQLTYSPVTGQVYKSKVNGNIGNDPSVTFSLPSPHPQPPSQLPTEITKQLQPPQAGLAAQSKIMEISLAISEFPIPNPPLVDTEFFVNVDNAASDHIAGYVHTNNGTDTLEVALNAITNSLIAQLPTFTVTSNLSTFTIRLEDASDFTLPNEVYIASGIAYQLKVVQIQPFIEVIVPDATEQRQVIRFPLTPDQVVPGANYILEFKDVAGVNHPVEYVASSSDAAEQILSGLIASIGTAQGIDDFFHDMFATLNTDSLSDEFSTSTKISLSASMTLPGSQWWELRPFPIALADIIERGGYANVLKEQGQTEKGSAEEQAVPTELQAKLATIIPPTFQTLTNQPPRSRYKMG